MKKNKSENPVTSIRIVLGHDNILEEFAPNEDYLLNPDIEEYIIDKAKQSSVKNSLQLQVKASEEDREVFSKALKKTLTQKIVQAQKDIKKQTIMSLVLLLVGIAILLIGYFFKTIELMYEVTLVTSWVFLWRAVELFFFKRQYNRFSILLYKRILAAEIKEFSIDIIEY